MSHPPGDYSEFLLALYREARTHEPGEFQRSALERLQNLVPFDFIAWGGGEAEDRQVNEVLVLNQDQRVLTEWSRIGHWDAFCDLTLQRLNETWKFDDIPAYRNSLAYNEHWRQFDVSHMMATIMQEPLDGYVSFVGLFHEDMRRPFQEMERTLVQGLMPHLSEALRVNRDLAVAREAGPEEGTALIDAGGRILACEGPFSELLEEEWGVAPVQRAPESIVHAARSNQGGWRGHRIKAELRRAGLEYLIRVQPLSPLDDLSPRAREAAELFGGGLSHKETARRMGLSPETVRKHLASVYEQLGIRSKASLARLTADRAGTQSHRPKRD